MKKALIVVMAMALVFAFTGIALAAGNIAPKTYEKAEAWAVDGQAQGLIGNLPLGVYLQYANASKSETNEPANMFNANAKDESAWSIVTELGVIPNRATVALSYRDGDTGAAANNEDNAFTLGATYLLTQNVELQANYSILDGNKYNPKPASGDTLTTLMLFASF